MIKRTAKYILILSAFVIPLYILLTTTFAGADSQGNNQQEAATPYEYQSTATQITYQPNSLIALNYHRVRDITIIDEVLSTISNSKELSNYSVSTQEFDRQMRWLMDHDANFLTMQEVIDYYEAGEFPPRSVWINFDDMDQTIYDNAHPILEEYQIPATGFVITGQVGNENFSNLELADEAALGDMLESVIWELDTHTHDLHYMDQQGDSMLIQTDPQVVFNDLKASTEYIRENYQTTSTAIAYPYGQGNDMTAGVLDELGIDYGFTLEEDVITPESNPHYLPRIMVNNDSFERLIETWKGFE